MTEGQVSGRQEDSYFVWTYLQTKLHISSYVGNREIELATQ